MRTAPNGLDNRQFAALIMACVEQAQYRNYCAFVAKLDQYRAEARDLMRQYGATPTPEPEDVIEDDERWDGGLE